MRNERQGVEFGFGRWTHIPLLDFHIVVQVDDTIVSS